MAHRPLCVLFLPFFGFLIAACLTTGCGGGANAGTTPTSPTTPKTPAAAPPVVTSVSPSVVPAGSAAFTLQVNGSGFVSGSVVSWNGTNLATTYVSATVLKAAVPASLATSGGAFTIAVANPDGQSSGSSNGSIVVDNPVPAISSLSPASVTAGAGPTNVVVTGTGFIQSSVASISGNARTTTVQSATQLTMELTAADLAKSGQVNVTVANPPPGGGVSAPATFLLIQPPPVITGVTPSSLIVGSPDTSVTVTGTGFTANSRILVDDIPQVPSSLTATTMNVTIPAMDLGTAIPVQLVVESGGGTSNSFSLPVLNPVPAIQSVSSPTVTAGSPGFTLTINATGVVSNTQVNVNGAAVAPNSYIGGPLMVPIAANLLAQVETVSISLTNPTPGGGTSNTVTLNVIAGSNYLRTVNLPANALAWNPQQQVIYAAIPAISSSNASSVVAIDPASGNIVATQQMPGEPTLLAISGDQQYLYVAMSATATIARLKLPGLAPDLQWAVGPVPDPQTVGAIYDMHVAPGLPHTIAVVQQATSSEPTEVAIYDDGVMRANTATGGGGPPVYNPVNVIQWGADASTLYGTEDIESGGPEYIYSINAQGATLASTVMGAFTGFDTQLVYDSSETRLYDPHGDVVDAATGKSLGSFPISSNSFAIDSSQRRVYFIGGTNYPNAVNSGTPETQIEVYDQDRFTSEGTIVLPAVTSTSPPAYGGANLIRWGTAGLAFNAGNSIYILDGPFVTPGAVPSSSVGSYATPPPHVSSLSPESVVAGTQDTTITLNGQNMTAATTVSWNNNNLATTFVNNTEVQATIPAAALATPTAAPVYVQNSPGEGISNLLAFSVLPNLGTGLQLTALNLSGSDMVWNAASNVLYVAVVNDDSIHPQTIATVDPTAGTIVSTLPVSANPFVLSISGDDQYLYAGFAKYANVQRYALPGLTPDLLIPLGIGDQPANRPINPASGSTESCDFGVSMAVAPGLDSTIVVTQGSPGIEPLGCGATAVIDGATPRPVNTSLYLSTGRDFSAVTWGADATAVYAQGWPGFSNQAISSLTVSSDGITFNQSSSTDIYLGDRPHFDAVTGLIYSDGGSVVQPSNLSQVGNFQASGLMVPDSTLGFAYFVGQTQSQFEAAAQGEGAFTLQIYDLHSYALLDSIVIPNVIGYPEQMVRWGPSGIAFTTENNVFDSNTAPGLTYILSGPEISAPSPSGRQKAEGTERVRLTWKPRTQMQRSAAANGQFAK